MTRLILHIGQTKTATTSIQAFLHLNERRLLDYGLCYLARHGNARSHRFLFHVLHIETFADAPRLVKTKMERLVALGFAVAGENPFDVCSRAWAQLEASLRDSQAPVALLSEELLWHLGGFRQERRLALLQTLRRRLEVFLDPADLMIVACLRHHADWAESWHNQLVKDVGNQVTIRHFVGHLAAVGAFRYAQNLADWQAVFPEALSVVVDFHGQLLAMGQPPGLALLAACGVLDQIDPAHLDQLELPRPLQEAIHPFVHHWITCHRPPQTALEHYRRAVRRASRQVSRLAERRFGGQRFTVLSTGLAANLNRWADDDDLDRLLDQSLISRLPERLPLPRPLPRRVRQLCAESFNQV